MGRLLHVLKHTGTAFPFEEDDAAGVWVEGEPGPVGPEPVPGVPFPCILFLPTVSEEANAFRPRRVSRPTLLHEPVRPDGSLVELKAGSDLLVLAPELAPWTGAEEARWKVEGIPQPFGPPGGPMIGALVTLAAVKG